MALSVGCISSGYEDKKRKKQRQLPTTKTLDPRLLMSRMTEGGGFFGGSGPGRSHARRRPRVAPWDGAGYEEAGPHEMRPLRLLQRQRPKTLDSRLRLREGDRTGGKGFSSTVGMPPLLSFSRHGYQVGWLSQRGNPSPTRFVPDETTDGRNLDSYRSPGSPIKSGTSVGNDR